MKTTEFFKKYANMPLDKRSQIILMNDFGILTWNGLYNYLKFEEREIRNIKLNGEGFKALRILEQKHWKVLQDMDKAT